MKSKRYHIIISTTLFGILMWVSINMTQEYVVTLRVPVVLKNISNQIAIKNTIPKELSFQVKGTGWHLTSLYITGNLQYVIDVSKIITRQTIHPTHSFGQYLKLPSSIIIIDASPDSIDIITDEYAEKKIKVIPQLLLQFRESYGQIGTASITPDSIIIGGAKSVIDTLSYWTTKPIRVTDIYEPINLVLELEEPPEYILKIFQQKVVYKLDVQPFAEKTLLGLNIKVNNLPPNKEVVIIPPKMDIIVRGSIEKLADISNADFSVYVNFQTLNSETLKTIESEIIAPPGIKVIQRNPEKFQYIIRKRLN